MMSVYQKSISALWVLVGVLATDDLENTDFPSRKLRGGWEKESLDDLALQIQPRIIGGQAVVPEEDKYPFFALMWGRGICGGTLITPSIVISAAHCQDAADVVTVGIQSNRYEFVGEYDSIPITRKEIYPDYTRSSYSNDVMLMKLARPSSKQYIRLNGDVNVPGLDEDLVVMGFGDTDASSSQLIPKDLHEANVTFVPFDTCRTSFTNQNLVQDDMMCAIGDGTDACSGDSGGPLIMKDGTSMKEDVLVGITAWGIGCADARYPGVYSRISYFYDWIVEQVCELSPDDAPDYMGCAVPTTAPTFSSIAPSISKQPSSQPTFSFKPSSMPSISMIPTPVPSISGKPTEIPTVMPTLVSSGTPSMFLERVRFVTWNVAENAPRLGHCEGDCDTDEDCEGNMICFRRFLGGSVPGCLFDGSIRTVTEELISDICIYPDDG